MKLSSIDFAVHKSYHDVPITSLDISEAEGVLSEERRKYLRTAAKEKTGQAAGAGALSSASKGVYSMMVKQAVRTHSEMSSRHTHGSSQPFGSWCCSQAVKQLWKEKHNEEADSATSPLSDVEYEEVNEHSEGDAHSNGCTALVSQHTCWNAHSTFLTARSQHFSHSAHSSCLT